MGTARAASAASTLIRGSFLFERCFEENTLEEIEKIDWSHVTVKTLDANYPPCSLPEGYSFVVKDIQYIKCYDSFEVTIEVDKQYWGDVTPYQAQIDGLTASAAERTPSSLRKTQSSRRKKVRSRRCSRTIRPPAL